MPALTHAELNKPPRFSPPQVLANPASFDVAVTTYDTIRSPQWGSVLSRTIRWRYLVLDEGHKIKNEDTQVSAAMRRVL